MFHSDILYYGVMIGFCLSSYFTKKDHLTIETFQLIPEK